MADHLSSVNPRPRILIVSRRTLRKNKFVDFVGEYHLDLIVQNGAVPVIVPRVSGMEKLLHSFEPIHGVLLCEGEDIDPSFYDTSSTLSRQELEQIRNLHASDTTVDREKDLIEFELVKLCLQRNIPYLGICRGSQLLNVACGGTLYQDIEAELPKECPNQGRLVAHINYDNYDGHRHAIKLVKDTPLYCWFKDSLAEEGVEEILVNSYHHQGVKELARRFVPMAFAPDGLVEGFYGANSYDPNEGRFFMGLQFHPERMRKPDSEEFDYPGCPRAYQEFVRAVIAYQKKVVISECVPKSPRLALELKESKSRIIAGSNSSSVTPVLHPWKEGELEAGAGFLELCSKGWISPQQQVENGSAIMAMQMGGTALRDASFNMGISGGREKMAKHAIGRLSVEQLSDLMSLYHWMGQACSEVLLHRKLQLSQPKAL
ncbi:putative glutamine amidotransferase GAT1_2.1 [Malania oleifera]|uniref:putative glutamine amidotransferase GAT1_2.1 n=1 Tax=Malania oleifera TaxID=397392 RepID=UPI0025AE6D24|nr:putative glutamine amidotransferase GAT1_2.1 [Malania oleifera]